MGVVWEPPISELASWPWPLRLSPSSWGRQGLLLHFIEVLQLPPVGSREGADGEAPGFDGELGAGLAGADSGYAPWSKLLRDAGKGVTVIWGCV